MSFMEKPIVERVLWGIIAVSALVFAVSYAFGQYVRYKQSNIEDLNAWMECVRTEQFTDEAYRFCQAKCSENYIFKKHFDWGDGRPDTDD
jgi:hypothetical protein